MYMFDHPRVLQKSFDKLSFLKEEENNSSIKRRKKVGFGEKSLA